MHKIKAKAKINLFLHITGKRPDGYHLLESIFYFPEIYDEIKIIIDVSEGYGSIQQLSISGEFADYLVQDDVQKNLVLKSYNILREKYPKQVPNLKFELIKNLPIASGIGGGSSDAASVINFIWNNYLQSISQSEILEIALKIGADVPACINQSTSWVSGIGENIEKIDNFPQLNILLVNPLKPVETKKIFEMGFKNYSPEFSKIPKFNSYEQLIEFLQNTKNDLQENAELICPEIKNIINEILSQNGCLIARLSGSGATCFGIFDSRETLELAKERLNQTFKSLNYWIKI